ncbi:MAG TPA: hypothetical protein VNC80_05135 [Mycobacteriales bacterium]|nr:hypothetical protein [Mycobacteriales bacterium]
MFRPIAAGIAAVVLLTACGPDDAGDTEPADFARSVCAGLTSWRDGVATESAELTRSLDGANDVATVRSRYGHFFTSTVRRTDQLIHAVDTAGAPKVDHGRGYSRDLTAALESARSGLASARKSFAALPTSDLTGYAAGARRIRDALGGVFTQVGTTLDELGQTYTSGDLNRAFGDEPACQRLSGT